MSESSKISNASLLFFVAILLAIGLRFANLGQMPLSEIEAGHALAALNFGEVSNAQSNTGSLYVFLTAISFQLFGSSDLTARFFPALFGSLVVLFPLAFRKTFGDKIALIMAFGLALMPALVSISRQAGSFSIALLTLAALVHFLNQGKSKTSGVALALALLSGPESIFGTFTFFTALALVSFLPEKSPLTIWKNEHWNKLKKRINARQLLLSFTLALFLGATFFLSQSQGIAAISEGLTSFLQEWIRTERLDGSKFLLALIAYGWPILIMALISLVRNRKNDPAGKSFFAIWSGLSLLLLILYPGRNAESMIWVLLPALYLAADELSRHLQKESESQIAFWGSVFLLLLLFTFQIINLSALANADPLSEAYSQRLLIAGAVLLLGIVALILIAGGWSKDVAKSSAYWTYAFIIFLVFLSQSARTGRNTYRAANELWQFGSFSGQQILMMETLDQLSDLNYGRNQELSIVVLSSSESLNWLLRSWQNTQFINSIAALEHPDIILNDDILEAPQQSLAYRGQDFILQSTINWEENWPPNLFAWLFFKKAPVYQQNVALWAREDLFPQLFQDNEIILDNIE